MHRVIRLLGILGLVLVLASCSSPAGSVVSIPIAATPPPGYADLCPQSLFGPFRLAGDPTKTPAVWGIGSTGARFPITWPAGFTARFTPSLEILDPSGTVVATGGVEVSGAGGGAGNGGVGIYVCGLNGKSY